MILATGADTVLFAISTLVGVAGALGVAYTVFRSASEQRLRDVDQHIINNQNLLMQQLESELSKIRTDLASAIQQANTYRESLTQRAAVDHLAEIVVRNEEQRRKEHEVQTEILKALQMLVRDIIAELRKNRGELA